MTELWIDDAPGERRAALVENGRIVEIHIQRTGHFALGELGQGRIASKSVAGVYLATDDGRELSIRKHVAEPEGARVTFEVIREAIAEPGLIKLAEARLIAEPALQRRDWEAHLDGLGAVSRLQHDISEAFDVALAGVTKAGDAVISFQRTKAGLVFDIDGSGDPLAINLAAATEIARLLRLYQVGAMVMIDFIAVDSKAARQAIAEAFDAATALDPRPFERTAVNGFGMMQVVRARPTPSVLDHLFGTRIASLSDETQALWLLREACQSTGFGARTVTAKPAVAAMLMLPSWRPLVTEAERLIGARLSIVADAQMNGYGHVHASQS